MLTLDQYLNGLDEADDSPLGADDELYEMIMGGFLTPPDWSGGVDEHAGLIARLRPMPVKPLAGRSAEVGDKTGKDAYGTVTDAGNQPGPLQSVGYQGKEEVFF